MTVDASLRYTIPGDNSVVLSDALADTVRKHFANDRENRFQLFLLAAGIRKRYLKKKGNKDQYEDSFSEWYHKQKMDKQFGQLSNFTKYGLAGELVAYTAKNAEKYLVQLPTTLRSLYSAYALLQKDKKVFEICLRVHPTRKSVDEPQTEWGTKGNDPLIHPHATSQEIEAFIERWFNTQQPEQSSPVDKKEMVLLAKVYVSKDLFNFDKKSGKHLGSIDMPDVETLLTNLQKTLPRGKSFAVENDIPKIKKKYYRTKDKSGPAAKILEKPSQRITKSKKKSSSNKTAKKA